MTRALTLDQLRTQHLVNAMPVLNTEFVQAAMIEEALRRTNQNRTHAAGMLGLSTRTLQRHLKDKANADRSNRQVTEQGAGQ